MKSEVVLGEFQTGNKELINLGADTISEIYCNSVFSYVFATRARMQFSQKC